LIFISVFDAASKYCHGRNVIIQAIAQTVEIHEYFFNNPYIVVMLLFLDASDFAGLPAIQGHGETNVGYPRTYVRIRAHCRKLTAPVCSTHFDLFLPFANSGRKKSIESSANPQVPFPCVVAPVSFVYVVCHKRISAEINDIVIIARWHKKGGQ
jgi:hypothetical protein